MEYVVVLVIALGVALLIYRRKKETPEELPEEYAGVPNKWKSFLNQNVNFYSNLSSDKKLQFESDVFRFLQEVRISGVKTEVELEDRLLVASSAVIPLFGFPAWNYNYLDEVLLYPSSFDRNFNMDNPDEIITGMVGNGVMEGKVIFSKPALHDGFRISNDKKNVGIHEFVHLLDKETGTIDGIPPHMNDSNFSRPWLNFVRQKMDQIVKDRSDIDDYGSVSEVEFLAVASEYFFERPHLLKKNHPKLYNKLENVFKQDLTSVIDPSSPGLRIDIGRNDPCPCGSGKKYKQCCLD